MKPGMATWGHRLTKNNTFISVLKEVRMKLKGRVALVTGASSGMGREIALVYAREGARVVVNCSKSVQKAKRVAWQIRRMGTEALVLCADMSKPKEIEGLVKDSLDHFKHVDILVNNAATTFWLPFNQITEDIWDMTINTNLKGPFLCIRALYDHFMSRKKGVIINISSEAGIDGVGSSPVYCVSKAGLIMMTKVVAKAMAPYVRVNSIAPGFTDTPWLKKKPRLNMKESIERIPLKRAGTPRDIALAALYLASDDASFITGQTLVVGGGNVML
jgi:NAD(P)-dependent dehydrogenase (short-subunit alcohol dehydrogenase family)